MKIGKNAARIFSNAGLFVPVQLLNMHHDELRRGCGRRIKIETFFNQHKVMFARSVNQFSFSTRIMGSGLPLAG
jgi:uncharacterized membrane protein YecN with MAPEG domain